MDILFTFLICKVFIFFVSFFHDNQFTSSTIGTIVLLWFFCLFQANPFTSITLNFMKKNNNKILDEN